MMEWLPESEEKILAVRVVGPITNADYQTFVPDFLKALPEAGTTRLLLDLTEFEGWEDEAARSQGFWLRTTRSGAFERVATLGHYRWRAEIGDLANAWPMTEVRQYEPAEKDEAWVWLRRD